MKERSNVKMGTGELPLNDADNSCKPMVAAVPKRV